MRVRVQGRFSDAHRRQRVRRVSYKDKERFWIITRFWIKKGKKVFHKHCQNHNQPMPSRPIASSMRNQKKTFPSALWKSQQKHHEKSKKWLKNHTSLARLKGEAWRAFSLIGKHIPNSDFIAKLSLEGIFAPPTRFALLFASVSPSQANYNEASLSHTRFTLFTRTASELV